MEATYEFEVKNMPASVTDDASMRLVYRSDRRNGVTDRYDPVTPGIDYTKYQASSTIAHCHSGLDANELAGLPALQGSEPGQVRKEAATAIYCKCRG